MSFQKWCPSVKKASSIYHVVIASISEAIQDFSIYWIASPLARNDEKIHISLYDR